MQRAKSIEEYQSTLGELVPKKVFETLFRLNLEKIAENSGQSTPDYSVIDESGNIIAICEVKSLVQTSSQTDSSLGTSLKELERSAELSKKRDKNHRDKVRRHHPTAMSQLLPHSNLPTILIFVSFDMTDHIDMLQVLGEHKELHPDAFMADLYILVKVHQNILPSNEFEVKETINTAFNTECGEAFSKKYLSTEISLQNAGALPLTFKIL